MITVWHSNEVEKDKNQLFKSILAWNFKSMRDAGAQMLTFFFFIANSTE